MFMLKVIILKPTEPTDNDDLPLETAWLFNIAQQSRHLDATKLRHIFSHTHLIFFFSLDFILLEFQFTGKTIQLLNSRLKGVQNHSFLTVMLQTQVLLRLCLNPVIIFHYAAVDSQN